MTLIKINGVNERQKQMLDVMWSLDDYEDVEEWKSSLSSQEQQQAEVLEQLIMLAVIDEMFEEDDFKEANDIINKIKNNCRL